MRKLFGRKDEAVTEVIGYVLSFALSAIFLLLALNVFWGARDNTEQVTTGVELKTIADRIAARVVEMGSISQEFPNATMNITIKVPQTLNGQTYTVTAIDQNVTARTRDGALSAVATNFKLESLPSLSVWGTVDSSNERVAVSYDLLTNGTKAITIRGG